MLRFGISLLSRLSPPFHGFSMVLPNPITKKVDLS